MFSNSKRVQNISVCEIIVFDRQEVLNATVSRLWIRRLLSYWLYGVEIWYCSIHKYHCSQLASTEAGTAVVLQHNTKEKPLFRSLHSIQRWMNQTSWQASRPGLYVESWKSMDHRKSSVSSFNALANATKSTNWWKGLGNPLYTSQHSQRNKKSKLIERARPGEEKRRFAKAMTRTWDYGLWYHVKASSTSQRNHKSELIERAR
jgi:hypothetical protein